MVISRSEKPSKQVCMGAAGAGAGPQRCLKKSGKSVEAYQNWHPFFRVAMEFPVEGLNNFLLNRAIECCRMVMDVD